LPLLTNRSARNLTASIILGTFITANWTLYTFAVGIVSSGALYPLGARTADIRPVVWERPRPAAWPCIRGVRIHKSETERRYCNGGADQIVHGFAFVQGWFFFALLASGIFAGGGPFSGAVGIG
jgi:hypothetical protein